MATKTINAVARLSFATDSMVPKMKKMLTGNCNRRYSYNPAIDVEAGVMVATDGFSMAAHKLQDYCFEPEEQTMLPVSVVLPVEVLKMKGTVTVVLYDNNEVVATDAEGTRAEMKQFVYPNWRTAVPSQVSDVITILPTTMTVALKELSKEVTDKSLSVCMASRATRCSLWSGTPTNWRPRRARRYAPALCRARWMWGSVSRG